MKKKKLHMCQYENVIALNKYKDNMNISKPYSNSKKLHVFCIFLVLQKKSLSPNLQGNYYFELCLFS